MIFNHFLITQFNLLQFPLGNELKEGEEWLNWTRERIELFKEYCLPSIDNQTGKNFTWLIYFDKQTPKEFNWIIEELKNRSYIKIRFSKGNDGFMKDHINDIREMSRGSEWIISSRIDNDDIFHKNAIKTIQDNFKPLDEYLISLTSGYTFNLHTHQMAHYFYPECPFISIIEKRDKKDIKSIFYKSHTQWDELKLKVFKELFNKNRKSTFIIEQPYWIQLVHGKNVSNSEKRGFPVIKQKDLAEFSLKIKNNKQSILSIPSFYSYPKWKRYLRGIILKFLR
uniref:glycosyltransferase n=1 Tax=uncultured Draconibacterium sp. TaxID=1573823 RepID=UPI003217316A